MRTGPPMIGRGPRAACGRYGPSRIRGEVESEMASQRASSSGQPTLIGLLLLCATSLAAADGPTAPRATSIRMGPGGTIVAVHARPTAPQAIAGAAPSYPFPRPRLTGFSPLIAITTSDAHSHIDIDYEHNLESGYLCDPRHLPSPAQCGSLDPPADRNFVVGVLDSGSVVDLAAGTGASTLGLRGTYLTSNVIPIGGVGGEVNALVTQPIGIYAAGLSAVDSGGTLDLNAVVGHSNVAALVAPPIDCGAGEVVTAFVGTPFLSFYNTVIRVDTPRRVTLGSQTFIAPDVRIQSLLDPIPEYPRAFAMEIGGISPVTTSSYFPDVEDLVTPVVPTQLSLSALSFPTGGAFFATVRATMGWPTNLLTSMRMMVDTGAQSSIISPAMAADLNLPRNPDFTIDACGVGGLVQGIPGYYIDYVRINAFGGMLEFSRAPFVVLDLSSPEGGPLDGILGMNFFWNRNVVFEPSLTGSSFFDVSDPIPVAFGDSDVDFHVDAADASFFFACMTGPGSMGVNPECDHLDADFDGSIDLSDLAKFQNCFSGPDRSADPNCGR